MYSLDRFAYEGIEFTGRDYYEHEQVPNSSAVAYINLNNGEPATIRDVFIERYWKAKAKQKGYKIKRRYRGRRVNKYGTRKAIAYGAALYYD